MGLSKRPTRHGILRSRFSGGLARGFCVVFEEGIRDRRGDQLTHWKIAIVVYRVVSADRRSFVSTHDLLFAVVALQEVVRNHGRRPRRASELWEKEVSILWG